MTKGPVFCGRESDSTYISGDFKCWVSDSYHVTDVNVTSSLRNISSLYSDWHGYVSLSVCTFGIITNVFNITVLTRKNMRTSTNHILTWLAVSDLVTMVSYVPFAIHFYCVNPPGKLTPQKNTYPWMMFLLFHINITTTTHTVSIWLCVALAIFRYLHIKYPSIGTRTRRRRMTYVKIIIPIIYAASCVALTPNYMSNGLKALVDDINNYTVYILQDMRLGRGDTNVMVVVNVWLYAMISKLIPCFLMSVFGGLLIYSIHVKIGQRRKRLAISGSSSIRLTEHSRTTKMLVAVIVLFLVTELPQGILIIISAVVEGFFDKVYLPLGDIMDITALVNNSINFVLYCTMSAQFRRTLVGLYCRFSRCTQESQAARSTSSYQNHFNRCETNSHEQTQALRICSDQRRHSR